MKFLLAAAFAVFALSMPVTRAAGLIADFSGNHERFSVFAATGFNAALGLHLFFGSTEKGN